MSRPMVMKVANDRHIIEVVVSVCRDDRVASGSMRTFLHSKGHIQEIQPWASHGFNIMQVNSSSRNVVCSIVLPSYFVNSGGDRRRGDGTYLRYRYTDNSGFEPPGN
jgi:hypothetical protein